MISTSTRSTVRIEWDLPSGLTLPEVHAMLRAAGCRLRQRQDGTLHAFPINSERHGNTNVVRIPRHSRQPAMPWPPRDPEVA